MEGICLTIRVFRNCYHCSILQQEKHKSAVMLLHFLGMSTTLQTSKDNLLHIHTFKFQPLVYVYQVKCLIPFI